MSILRIIRSAITGFILEIVFVLVFGLIAGFLSGEIDFYTSNVKPFSFGNYAITILGGSLGWIIAAILDAFYREKK